MALWQKGKSGAQSSHACCSVTSDDFPKVHIDTLEATFALICTVQSDTAAFKICQFWQASVLCGYPQVALHV